MAFAQTGVRPPRERPLAQEPEVREPPPEFGLPPGPQPEPDRLSAGLSVLVREYRVVGSTVFSPEDFARVTAPYSGRRIDSEELLEARDAVTALYVENGFITSGAVIPDQSVDDGVVRIRVVKGTLAEVRVEGPGTSAPESATSRTLAARENGGAATPRLVSRPGSSSKGTGPSSA